MPPISCWNPSRVRSAPVEPDPTQLIPDPFDQPYHNQPVLHPLLEDLLEHLGCQPGHLECRMTHRTVELGPPGHKLTGDLAFECRPVVFEERPLFVPELMIVVPRHRCLAELRQDLHRVEIFCILNRLSFGYVGDALLVGRHVGL
jgi:hypothetical protein